MATTAIHDHTEGNRTMITIQLTEAQIAALQIRDKQVVNRKHREGISTSKDAYRHVQHLGALTREHLMLLSLDSRHRLIATHEISVGTVDASLVHPREVFRPAIIDGATLIVLAHNHPSGLTEPSEEDGLITKRLITAGKVLGIELLDHLIVGEDDFYSFRDNDRIK
jgi:DNA repair protein RadC